jgi:hypothetical protein
MSNVPGQGLGATARKEEGGTEAMNRDSVKGILALLSITLWLAWASGTAERIALIAIWTVVGTIRWLWMRRSATDK